MSGAQEQMTDLVGNRNTEDLRLARADVIGKQPQPPDTIRTRSRRRHQLPAHGWQTRAFRR